MTRLFIPFLLFVLLCHGAMAAPSCDYSPRKNIPVSLKRGVNLSGWWEGLRPAPPKPKDLENIRALGFGFARLPINPSWLEIAAENQPQALDDIRCSIVSLLKKGLTVVVDLHASPAAKKQLIPLAPEEAAERLKQLWLRLQPVLKGLPPQRILLGLYNEPDMEPAAWWAVQENLVRSLRAVYPKNTFVASAGHGGWDLTWVKPYRDRNIVYDFHFYVPMEFTHYGAKWFWGGPTPLSGDPVYPSEENHWDRAGLAKALQLILEWKKLYGARLVCLEFGVYRPFVDRQSRVNWLKDVRQLLESHGIPWALWEYEGNFGLLDPNGKTDAPMASALGLRHN